MSVLKKKSSKSNWSIFWVFLWNRMKKPIDQPSYVFYFVFIILMIGSAGLISELSTSTFVLNGELDEAKIASLVLNMSNISISLIAASVIEMILINEEDLIGKYNRKVDIQIFGVSSLILSFFLWIFANKFSDNVYGLVISIFGLLFSYLFWWIANAENKVLLPDKDPIDTLGGKTGKDSLAGNTKGFITE
jgi:hypothetical protein